MQNPANMAMLRSHKISETTYDKDKKMNEACPVKLAGENSITRGFDENNEGIWIRKSLIIHFEKA